jgi:hypothetical protein
MYFLLKTRKKEEKYQNFEINSSNELSLNLFKGLEIH